MLFRNDGKGEANIIQNHFTAYVVTAIRHKKTEILQKRTNRQVHEVPMEICNWVEELADGTADLEESVFECMRDHTQIRFENENFESAFNALSERERYVFFARILEEQNFEKLAAELGMTYKGVAAIYYRAIQKMKNRMRGDEK